MTTVPDDEFPQGIARFWDADGQVVGCGFLVAERTLATCAHVVASALGTDESDPVRPPDAVMVDFPLLTPPSARLPAMVSRWQPVASDGGGDIALLTLEETVEKTAPVRFAGGTAVWDHAFRVLGFPSRTDDHGVWVDGRLRAPVGKGWTSMEARPDGPSVGRGFSGGPVWDTDQGGVVGMTVAAETGTGATTAYLIPAASLLGLDPSLCPSPFRGLEPFREQDADLFFARREDSERITRAVRRQPFVPVAGASGVGKSSLVRAGVLPLLREAGYSVTDFVGQPGAEPVGVLLATLRHQFPRAGLPEATGPRLSPQAAVLTGARVLDHCGPAGHVVVLDQFEETVGAQPARARELLDTLLTMATARHQDGRHFRVLTTLRSASLEDLAAGGDAERLSVTVQMVAPMTPAQLGEIVRRPLQAVPGIEFEAGLADLIVTDAGTEPGALPLVEFALAQLWENREHGRLTHASYRELGGVEGALAAYADQQLAEVCKAPDGPAENVARRLFEQLALPDGDQGYARVARAYTALPSDLRAAVQAMAATRLLVIGRDSAGRETVALAHESLVRQWPTLRAWLNESRAFRAWQERLRLRLREWEDGGQHADLLLRGQELAAARAQMKARSGELDAAEGEFIDRSRRHRRRTARRGRAGVALVAVLAVLAGLLVFVVRWEIGQTERREREEAANALADRSLDRAVADPVESAALAVLAHRTARTDKTNRALLSAYPAMSMVRSVHEGFLAGRVVALAASADGGRVALLEEATDGGVRGFVVTGLAAGKPVKQPITGLPEDVDAVAVSDDGTRVAVAGPEGQGMVWSTDAHSTLDRWPARAGVLGRENLALDFSADGQLVLHATKVRTDGTCSDSAPGKDVQLHVRDTQTGRDVRLPTGLLRPDMCLTDVALPAGHRTDNRLILLSETTDDYPYPATVRVHALDPGQERLTWDETGLDSVLVGAGGRTLGMQRSTEFDGTYRDPATGRKRDTAGAYRAEDRRDPTGRFVGDDAGFAVLWHDTVSGADHVTLDPFHRSAFYDTDECPESAANLVTRSARGSPVLHTWCGRDLLSLTMRPARSLPSAHSTARAEFAPSGRSWAVLGSSTAHDLPKRQDTVSVFTGERLREQQVAPGSVAFFEFDGSIVHSADGRRLVVWGELGWVLYEVRATGLEPVAHQLEAPADPEPDPVVRDVRALGGQDFLLLDKHGIRRLHGDGRMSSAHAPECGEPNPRSVTYCLAVAVSPKQDGTAWVLRRDGTLTSWDPDDDGVRRHTVTVGLPADGFRPQGLRFRDDGNRLAVVVRDWTTVLNPVSRRVEHRMPTPLMTGIVAYAGNGHMVFVKLEGNATNVGNVEVWSDDGAAALADFGKFWTNGAWRFAHGALHAAGRWGSWSFPLDDDTLVTRLCRALGDYDPPHLHKDARPNSYRGSPCADRQ
ncbi:trypsin-like peptidase domain-containing protein [Streptomyces sp. NBC_00038]|uniref:nSTAND1 domain-containing NTPase n=1 Tax=Streptomyces sp. NBC_00038 TaxID=2903615 RepID=UPI00225276BE|nr:trypsin-like peptidase domain-containing protein [Streptomyces sp. NBC_00038]MCX5562889.1 trypsin-like peptidase domain-containing protein [Streptomyces sp. NBC_00038]